MRRCMSTAVIKTSAGKGVSRAVVVAQKIEDPDNLKKWAHDTPIKTFGDCELHSDGPRSFTYHCPNVPQIHTLYTCVTNLLVQSNRHVQK